MRDELRTPAILKTQNRLLKRLLESFRSLYRKDRVMLGSQTGSQAGVMDSPLWFRVGTGR